MRGVAAPATWIAGTEETDEVVRLLGAFRDWYGYDGPPDATIRAVVERLIGSDGAEYVLAAAQEGGPAAGVAQVRYRPSIWTGSDDCWIEDVFVEESARGTGLGRALVERVLARATERGCGRVELDVDVVNEPARALYAKLGFTDKTEGGSLLLKRRLRDP